MQQTLDNKRRCFTCNRLLNEAIITDLREDMDQNKEDLDLYNDGHCENMERLGYLRGRFDAYSELLKSFVQTFKEG